MGTNLAYSLHFYTCSHGATNRAYAMTAVSKGAPLFITEWAATNFTGGKDGSVCADLSKPWMDFAATYKIGWTAWQLNACTDLSCVLKPDVPVGGGWTDAQLNGQATYVRGEMKKP
jgi:endoglucanase